MQLEGHGIMEFDGQSVGRGEGDLGIARTVDFDPNALSADPDIGWRFLAKPFA